MATGKSYILLKRLNRLSCRAANISLTKYTILSANICAVERTEQRRAISQAKAKVSSAA